MKTTKKLLAIVLSVVLILGNASLFASAQIIDNPNGLSAKPQLYVTFDNGAAQNLIEGSTATAEIVGSPTFSQGIDGGKAIRLKNTYGKKASQYIKFSGTDMSGGFTVSFWYKENGVCENKGITVDGKTVTWNGFETFPVNYGGTIASTTETATAKGVGGSLLSLPGGLYATYNISNGIDNYAVSNKYQRTTLANITDTRWHNITIAADMSGARFYVDSVLSATQDISFFAEGDITKLSNVFALGADVLGQYGILDAEFDEVMFFNYALDVNGIELLYNKANLLKLINEIKTDLFQAEIGSRFDYQDIDEMANMLNAVHQEYESGNITNYKEVYNRLWDEYNSFLMGNQPNQVVILSSDTHMKSGIATNARLFMNMINAAKALPYPATTMINAGDYDENRIDNKDGQFFDYVKNKFINGMGGKTVAVAVGNHQYTHPGNTGETIPVDQTNFIENCAPYADASLEPNKSIVDGTGKLTKTYYYAFDGSAHYVVVNNFENSTQKLKINMTKEQLAWVDSTLNYAQADGKPIFIINHYGPNSSATGFMDIVRKYDNIFYISGHTHDGFGSNNVELTRDYTLIELPSTSYTRASHGVVSGGIYFGFIYDDCLVLRAYSTDDEMFMPEYDRVIPLEKEKYDTVTVKEKGEEKEITGLNKATAKSYGYNATMQNTGFTQARFDEIIANNTDASGSIVNGYPAYVKDDATGDYSYNLYDTALSTINSRVSDGLICASAKKYNASTGQYKATSTTSEFYINNNYRGNVSLKEAVNAGKATFGTDPIAVVVYRFDGKTDINSILLATGGISAPMTSRKYDIFVSDSMEDIYEDYNKVLSFDQDDGNVNTVSEKWYYDWDNATYTTTPITNQEVTWPNAQYIQFNGNNVPKGKYLAWVVYDGGNPSYMRADISELRVFTQKPYECTVNFNDKNGNLLKQVSVPVGSSIREALSPTELSEIENLIPEISSHTKGRTVLGEKRYWTASYDQTIMGNTSYTAIYSEHTHNWEWVVDSAAGCSVTGKKHEVCTIDGCSAVRNENTAIPATGAHTWSKVDKTYCDKAGVRTFTCTVCKEVRTAALAATDHKWVKTKEVKATYDKAGTRTFTCSVCKGTTTETLAKLAKTSLAKAKITVKDQTYSGKTLKPSITVKLGSKKLVKGTDYTVSYKNNKNIGKATVTITGIKKYKGTVSKTFKINPKKVTKLKVKAGKKKMTVSWKKDTNSGGYEILYATSKNFKKGKKTVKIKSYKTAKKVINNLKSKKTYYVKVRTFKKVSGTTYYGTYTSSKKIKIK